MILTTVYKKPQGILCWKLGGLRLYEELSISQAVEEVKNGEQLSTVARKYHVSRDLLHNSKKMLIVWY